MPKQATDKLLTPDSNNPDNGQKVCSHCKSNCPFRLLFELPDEKNIGEVAWELKEFKPHNEHCTGVESNQKRNHTATSTQLAPALYDSLQRNATLTCKNVISELWKYLSMVPKESYAKRALAMAKEDLHGTKMDQAGMMMAINAAFEKKGHTLNVYETRGKESQKNIICEQ